MVLLILTLLRYYRFPLGRNLSCLLTGYGLFLAFVVGTLAVRWPFGASFDRWWVVLQPSEYLVTLVVWCVGLWKRSPDPIPMITPARDYDWVLIKTAQAIARLRARLLGVMR